MRFHGNEMTSRNRVEGDLLYRAAELTIQNGCDWFLVVDRHTENDVSTYARPDPLYLPYYGGGYGYWRPHWRYYSPGLGWDIWHPEFGDPLWADRLDITTIESFEADAEIVMEKGPAPAGEERAIDARRVMAELGPKIVLPEPR